MSQKSKKIIAAMCVLLYLLICGLIFAYVGTPFIKFVNQPERFRLWIDERGFLGKTAFLLMVALQVLVAVIPGEPLEIAAGYAFGGFSGALICLTGIALGELIVFLFVRKFGMRAVEIFISREKINSVKFIKKAVNLERIMFILFLIPGTPKDIFTYFAGLTKIKLSSFLVISIIARVPSILSSTIGGSALSEGNYTTALLVFVVTAAISATGLGIYSLIKKHKAASN